MHYLLMPMFLLLSLPSFSIISKNDRSHSFESEPFVKGHVLVKIDMHHSVLAKARIEREFGMKNIENYSLVEGLGLYRFDPKIDVMEIVKQLSAKDYVIYAEPDYIYHVADQQAFVDDSEFPRQWALENKAQTGGKIDADINAELMWTYQKGSRNVVIGITDTGIDYTHPDLIDNLWRNGKEIPDNNVDDDQNGFVDDIFGINAIKKTGTPLDDNMHGTHVAGIIGAVGDNHLGVVGVAQQVQIAACKFLSSSGSGSLANALVCMEYFAALKSRADNPINLVATNNSWGGGGVSQSMLDAIKAHERLGILFIAAAGNDSSNNDNRDTFPANYNVANVISVAATDHNDRIATFSNYGKKTVHVAAPGVKVLSTILSQKYGELSGTSMAAPHVTGLSAVIASQFNELNYFGIKNLIMTGGQKTDATANTTISGKRIRGADENGIGSLTCNNQILVVRNQPTTTTHKIPLNKPFFLSALHINCEKSAGPLTLYQNGDISVVLEDGGEHGDVAAQDGLYSLNWTPTKTGIYELRFSDTDSITVEVYDESSLLPESPASLKWHKNVLSN